MRGISWTALLCGEWFCGDTPLMPAPRRWFPTPAPNRRRHREPGWNLPTACHVLAARGPACRPVTRRRKAGSVSDSETPAACEVILRRLDDYVDRELSLSEIR